MINGWLVPVNGRLAGPRINQFGNTPDWQSSECLLLPIGYVYGEWVKRLPDAAGEAAYTAQVFPPLVSYFTGWIMLLAYLIVCPWEAVAVGKLASYLIPSLNSFEIYRIARQPVFLPRLLLGILMTLFLAALNYRGIRASALFQGFATTAVLVLFAIVAVASGFHGSIGNFHPGFSAAPLISILLVLQIVPYFMTGFESVPKAAEEAQQEFRPQGFFRAIVLALLVGAGFYVAVIAAVSYAVPWQTLLGKRFATARVRSSHGNAVARSTHSDRRDIWPFSMLQWKFCCRQPPVVFFRQARHHTDALGRLRSILGSRRRPWP